MAAKKQKAENISIKYRPLTPDRWKDLETLFGDRGACGGCWCMWWRLSRSVFNAQKGEQNKKAFKKIVKDNKVPGLLAYHNDFPIGWCAFAPREEYPALERSRVLKPVDEQKVWSITCFFVAKQYRKAGVSIGLLQAAIKHVKKMKGKILEGYPIDFKNGNYPDTFAYTGLYSAFVKAGFTEAARRSETRPIMRFYISS